MIGLLWREKTCNGICYSFTIQIKIVKDSFTTVHIQMSFIFVLLNCPANSIMTLSIVIRADSAGEACLCSVPAVYLHVMSCATPWLPPSVQQEVGRREAAEVRCNLLGTVWRSCGLKDFLAQDTVNMLRWKPESLKNADCLINWKEWNQFVFMPEASQSKNTSDLWKGIQR